MAVELRPAASRFRQPVSEHNALPDNRLAFIDQAAFLGLRATGRPDGTDADQVFLRLTEQNCTPRGLERTHGQLFPASGRTGGKIFITVTGYQLGGIDSKHGLRGLAAQTLAEFDLTNTIG